MNRPKLVRYLRLTIATVCSITCLLLLALWARSDDVEDRASGHLNGIGARLYSSRGWIVCSKNNVAVRQNYPWELGIGREHWLDPTDARLQFSLSTDFFRPGFASVSIPHWLPVMAISILGTIAAFGQARFSLRTLLMTITLVAVGLGLIVAFQ
jgi:hypothetical protein